MYVVFVQIVGNRVEFVGHALGRQMEISHQVTPVVDRKFCVN